MRDTQELEAAGHIVSAVRKQRDLNPGAQLALSLQAVLDPEWWDDAPPSLGWVLPPHLT